MTWSPCVTASKQNNQEYCSSNYWIHAWQHWIKVPGPPRKTSFWWQTMSFGLIKKERLKKHLWKLHSFVNGYTDTRELKQPQWLWQRERTCKNKNNCFLSGQGSVQSCGANQKSELGGVTGHIQTYWKWNNRLFSRVFAKSHLCRVCYLGTDQSGWTILITGKNHLYD